MFRRRLERKGLTAVECSHVPTHTIARAAIVHWLDLSRLNGINMLSLFPKGYKMFYNLSTHPLRQRTTASNTQLPTLAQPEEPLVYFSLQPSTLISVLFHYTVLPKVSGQLNSVKIWNYGISHFKSLEP